MDTCNFLIMNLRAKADKNKARLLPYRVQKKLLKLRSYRLSKRPTQVDYILNRYAYE